MAAVEAVGFAGLANRYGSPELKLGAKRRYGDAISRVGRTVSVLAEFQKDRTLLAVLLLVQFEVNVFWCLARCKFFRTLVRKKGFKSRAIFCRNKLTDPFRQFHSKTGMLQRLGQRIWIGCWNY